MWSVSRISSTPEFQVFLVGNISHGNLIFTTFLVSFEQDRLGIKHKSGIPVFPGVITTIFSLVDRSIISIYLSSFSFQCYHGNNINLLFPDHLPKVLCSVGKWTLQQIKCNHDLLPVWPADWIPKSPARIFLLGSLGFLYTK